MKRIFVIAALLLSACADTGETETLTAQEVCSRDVVYEVGGTAETASITIENAGGNTEQADISVPLTNEAGTPGLHLGSLTCGTFVYISAQNLGETGYITCAIVADGEPMEEAESSGAYAIASCSGTVR